MALVVHLSQDRRNGDVTRVHGSKVHNTGAQERTSFSASKLAWVSAVHMNRPVGLPSAVNGAATSA